MSNYSDYGKNMKLVQYFKKYIAIQETKKYVPN